MRNGSTMPHLKAHLKAEVRQDKISKKVYITALTEEVTCDIFTTIATLPSVIFFYLSWALIMQQSTCQLPALVT